MFLALTGKPPATFSEDNLHRIEYGIAEDPFKDYVLPTDFQGIVMSNEMVFLMLKLLSKEPGYRPKSIAEVRVEINKH
jgi:hypothetical protein